MLVKTFLKISSTSKGARNMHVAGGHVWNFGVCTPPKRLRILFDLTICLI